MLVSSRSKTHVIVISVSPAEAYPSAQATTHASPYVKEEQSKSSTMSSSRSALLGQHKTKQTDSGSSSLLFCAKVLAKYGNGRRDANGELPTRICGGVAVEVACPSGQCYYPRLGLVVLCTSGQCILPGKRDCRFLTYSCRDEGACLRIVNLGRCFRSQAPPTIAIKSDSPELGHTMF